VTASSRKSSENPDDRKRLSISAPNVARMYDFYLRGKDNFQADREAALKVLAAAPEVPRAALENREFLKRALRFLIEEAGIRQFIDIGPGLPTQSNVHHIAQQLSPDCRVVYIDNDPVVVAHGRAHLANNNPNVIMIDGDLREPDHLLADPALNQLIDTNKPVGLLLTLVLHFIPDEQDPSGVVAAYRDWLLPGSYLVISHVTSDGRDREVLSQVTDTYRQATAPLVMRSRTEVTKFFTGFDLASPGVVYLTQWRPILLEASFSHPGNGGTRWAYAGMGRKLGGLA